MKIIDSNYLLSCASKMICDYNLHGFFFLSINNNNRLLNGNRISSIEEDTFLHLTQLHDLELNGNKLAILSGGTFKHLGKLRKL